MREARRGRPWGMPVLFAAVALLAGFFALPARTAQAQDAEEEWPVRYHDAQNTSATNVALEGDYLALDWAAPIDVGGWSVIVASGRVFNDGEVLSADDGARLAMLRGIRPAVDAGRVFLMDDSAFTETALLAYWLGDFSTAWPAPTVVLGRDFELTARGGSLYAICRYSLRKVHGATGAEQWSTDGFPYLPKLPAVADVVIEGSEREVAFVGSWITNKREFPEHKREYSVYAFDTTTGGILWKKWLGTGMFGLSVDPSLGLVYGGEQRGAGSAIHAFHAANGEIKWSAALNYQVHSPPTLGWVGGDRVLFCVTGLNPVVYAFRANSGDFLWEKSLCTTPGQNVTCNAPITYAAGTDAGGRLYFASDQGVIYVLDAASGNIVQTRADRVPGETVAVVSNSGGHGRLFTRRWLADGVAGLVCYKGSATPPLQMSLAAAPASIPADGQTKSIVTATLPSEVAGAGVEITFTTNLGRLSATTVETDDEGKATTELTSASPGTAVVLARCGLTETAYVVITVQAPPPPTGSIVGTVTEAGAPVKGADVHAVHEGGTTYHAETGRDGTYGLTDLPLGVYDVYAEKKRGKQVKESEHKVTTIGSPGEEVTVDLSF